MTGIMLRFCAVYKSVNPLKCNRAHFYSLQPNLPIDRPIFRALNAYGNWISILKMIHIWYMGCKLLCNIFATISVKIVYELVSSSTWTKPPLYSQHLHINSLHIVFQFGRWKTFVFQMGDFVLTAAKDYLACLLWQFVFIMKSNVQQTNKML